jgi:hypothetical protein
LTSLKFICGENCELI